MLQVAIENIHWLGHAGFMIVTGERVVYIDPWLIEFPDAADLILITHDHEHHCVPSKVKWMRKGSTLVVAPPSCVDKFWPPVDTAEPGKIIKIKGLSVEVVPAYNADVGPHPRESGGVGYILTTVEGMRIYHAGDTDLIPEMLQVKADVALLPVGGGPTMNAAEAAQAANYIKPQVAIPMHWGSTIGSAEDAQRFRDLAQVEVRLLEPGGSYFVGSNIAHSGV